MIAISHRGNLTGSNLEEENKPEQIYKVLNLGYQCEVDLWKKNGDFYLGHDKPQYPVDYNFLCNKSLWIHCKNLEALECCPAESNYFWHQQDDFTLTSHGYIWTFPNQKIGKKSIIVDNTSNWKEKNYNCFAVCSDHIL